jgi:chromosomal replication initiator protein
VPLQDGPEDSPAALTWKRVLRELEAQGRHFALEWLAPLRAREVAEGTLVLEARDRYWRDWVGDHYAQLLRAQVEKLGLQDVRLVAAGECTPPPPGGG